MHGIFILDQAIFGDYQEKNVLNCAVSFFHSFSDINYKDNNVIEKKSMCLGAGADKIASTIRYGKRKQH